ncbi:MAG: hypothetical protein B7X48_08840 [Acidiphilium sp. 34-60-192]|nr:MAG: hypothetical protein B7X48_08840 [Acidiphilium sp. 34-60-192]
MSAAIACQTDRPAAPILPRIRAHGADVVMREGRPVLQNVSKIGSILLEEVKARRDDLIAELTTDAGIIVPCSRCGTPSHPFLAIINPDLWQCDTCLPADPNDQAAEAIERQAIIAEGKPSEPVLIAMPVSWADASLVPTAGARCRNCKGNGWWCERDQPRGWRCSTCHPGDHLPADRRRDVVT